MGKSNCCGLCTPPPESFTLGACCHDPDGDNIKSNCEENVSQDYCLIKPNSVFSIGVSCGEKITCENLYEGKVYATSAYTYAAIKSDGSVITLYTNTYPLGGSIYSYKPDDFYKNSGLDRQNFLDQIEFARYWADLITDRDKQKIQPIPYGDNGAVKIYTNGDGFCAVQKKDGSFVVFGRRFYPTMDRHDPQRKERANAFVQSENSYNYGGRPGLLIEPRADYSSESEKYFDIDAKEEIENNLSTGALVVDIKFTSSCGLALRSDGTVYQFSFPRRTIVSPPINNKYEFTYYEGDTNEIPKNLLPLLSNPENPVVEIHSVTNNKRISDLYSSPRDFSFRGAFCVVLKNRDAYVWGEDMYHSYDVNRDGKVSALDVLQVINHTNIIDAPYEERFDVNKDGAVTAQDALTIINYLARHGNTPYDPNDPDSGASDAFSFGEAVAIPNVKTVFSGAKNFHFIKNDGSFFSTLNTGKQQSKLTNVKHVAFTETNACAINHDGTVVTWGPIGPANLDTSTEYRINSFDSCYVRKIKASRKAFCLVICTPDDPNIACDRFNYNNGLFVWGYNTDRQRITGNFVVPPKKIYNTTETELQETRKLEIPVRNLTESNTEIFVSEPHEMESFDNFYNGTFVLKLDVRYNPISVLYFGNVPHPNGFDELDFYNVNLQNPQNRLYDNLDGDEILDVKFTNDAFCFEASQEQDARYRRVYSKGHMFYGSYGKTNTYYESKYTPLRRYLVRDIVSNANSFAGITNKGTLVCWGPAFYDRLGGENRGHLQDYELGIVKQLKKIGNNFTSNNEDAVYGYEGCFSDSNQKDFCKTEEYKRPDCNIFTGECGYNLGNFFPFHKVDACEDCEDLSNLYINKERYFNEETLEFYSPKNEACFARAKSFNIYDYQTQVLLDNTYGESYFTAEGIDYNPAKFKIPYEDFCKSKSSNSNYAQYPILGGIYARTVELGIEPSGSCCVGVLCDERYEDVIPNTNQVFPSQSCKDLKICYDNLTESQCRDQRFSIDRIGGVTNYGIYFQTYNHFSPDTKCSDRLGEKGC